MFTPARNTARCILFIIVGIAVAIPPSTELPNGIVQCRLHDPFMNKCLKEQMIRAYPLLVKGIPELGLVPIDPLWINKLEVSQGFGSLKINFKFQDLVVKNMGSTVIKVLEYDPKNMTYRHELLAKKPIVVEGQYETNGRLLLLPMVGNGTCKYILDDFKVVHIFHMIPKLNNGKTYMIIDQSSLKITTSRLHQRLDNLFGGDKTLGDNMNVFLNENWREILKELQPSLEDTFSSVIISLYQVFLNRVPLDDIFLDYNEKL